MRTRRLGRLLLAGLATFALSGCPGDVIGGGESDTDMAGGGGGGGDGGGATDMRATINRDAACAKVAAEASLTKKPVDIIFVVDNSGSMGDEIQAVQNNINKNFADIIGSSGIDFRVILISKHGAISTESICISAPLSGAMTCNPPPAKPVNTARFFHYDTEIASTDSLSMILSTYNAKDANNFAPNGWAGWLRDGAFKVFIEITDDNSALAETSFETQLFAKTPKQFGTMANRNYVFHTIAGLKENNPATKAWGPMDPLQTAKCTNGGGAVNNSIVYQRLSVATGGLRFPICEHASFDAVFRAVATGVVEGSKIACDFKFPDPPAGQMIDPNTFVVEFTPGNGGPAQEFKRVGSSAQCAANSFYVQNGRIYLCPDTCTMAQMDTKAKLQVLFSCVIG